MAGHPSSDGAAMSIVALLSLTAAVLALLLGGAYWLLSRG
jgi:hypothetical protein